jgi:dCTP deaminase
MVDDSEPEIRGKDGASYVPDLLGVPTPADQRRQRGRVEVKMSNGVQPVQFIREFVNSGVVVPETPIIPDQLQPASLDLRLGSLAYRVRSSFLPGAGAKVMDRVHQMDGYKIDITNSAVLDTGQVYVIPLQEALALPDSVQAFANPKSSTGRLDILTRLVTDSGIVFDRTPKGYNGPLFLEVAPQTFSIVVRPGTRLNQIRFQRGTVSSLANGELRDRYRRAELTRPNDRELDGNLVPVTIDLRGEQGDALIGFRARPHTDRIDIEKVSYYDWLDYWDPILIPEDRPPILTLNPGDFYILATREDVRVPPEYAAEMVPYSTRSGEYRVHYAGFFDPGFGWDVTGGGSKGVLEVRSHEIPFMLEHGQTVGWLRYDKMAAVPSILYGPKIGSSYHRQGLALGKQFTRPPRPQIPPRQR